MRKIFGAIMCMALLSAMIIPASAQSSRSRYYGSNGRYENRNRSYENYRSRRYRDNRSFWDKHRDKTTVGIGAGAGAAVGALTGGKKGAIIGALLGAGGAALYTYKLRDRNNNYRRYRRN